ncbi:MAG: flagellar export chaperone FliS [Anaerosolibacter sp.]|jgi:flagellar protein FliS|uniref:flagellar export chaperone FliS n=1 Tax=Anaerosolibacter sp. TaxID=1872527 RepID=UPI0026235D03|nr:flagellar export chaperone FliS [Anaerosolibacter sp.]MDF2546595.1 flagellar export chaperone FliS [Anaerosolibacter sp.]
MALKNPYNQYKQNNIMQASPQELTLMLYNGAIKFTNLGIIGIDEKNIEKANNSILRARDIITELNITLDMNYDISKQLSALYNYILTLLLEANIRKERACLQEALDLITQLRDTWKEAMVLSKQE